MGIVCFPQQTCPSLRPTGKRLHQEQAKNNYKTSRDTVTQSKKFKCSGKDPYHQHALDCARRLLELIDIVAVGDDLRLPQGADV
jgi:hypothetical protein